MKSPFPGMDPYLECHWGDVHQRLCTYACDQIQEQLGGPLIARLGERLVVESLLDKPRSIYPDVRVVEQSRSPVDQGGGTATTPDIVATEPDIYDFGEAETQAYVEIIEPDSATVVTVIEFLSPSNKWPGEGRTQYQKKQQECVAARVNMVEIDLIRAGPWAVSLPHVQVVGDNTPTYVACVFRATRLARRELYPISLRDRLPVLKVPLRPGDADILLKLQPLLDMVYRNGRYDRTDYRRPCIPPLEGDDAEWAQARLKSVANV